jgi:hypothetical protein
MSRCCDATSGQKTPRALRGVREILAWVLPSIALIFMPKCPACLAAYVALWTGIGLSLSTATYLRWAMLFLCLGSILFLIVKWLSSMSRKPKGTP